MIVLGLTGSIGMGKSTTAAMFAAEGAAVFDADAAVHALYAAGGPAGPRLRSRFPEAVDARGAVDRKALAACLKAAPGATATLESLVFPLVADARARFIDRARGAGMRVAVLDVPLLLETGGDAQVDAVVVVTASRAVQHERVLDRPGMDAQTFALLDARQMSDADKRARADYIVHTDGGFEAARVQVRAILREVTAPGWPGRSGQRTEESL